MRATERKKIQWSPHTSNQFVVAGNDLRLYEIRAKVLFKQSRTCNSWSSYLFSHSRLFNNTILSILSSPHNITPLFAIIFGLRLRVCFLFLCLSPAFFHLLLLMVRDLQHEKSSSVDPTVVFRVEDPTGMH